jgi:hypothetical protein
MPKTVSLSLLVGIITCVLSISALAGDRIVKVDRFGNVNLSSYQCKELNDKYVHELCYAKKSRSLIAKLGDKYKGFCGVPKSVFADWKKSAHKKTYYQYVVEGKYACSGK